MTDREPPDGEDVRAILAALGDRPVEEVGDRIGSLELTWLITQIEERYDTTLDLTDDELSAMMTVPGAVAALCTALAGRR